MKLRSQHRELLQEKQKHITELKKYTHYTPKSNITQIYIIFLLGFV